MSINMHKFLAIGQTVAEIWQFFDFVFKMAAIRRAEF